MCPASHSWKSNHNDLYGANFGGMNINCDGSNISPVALAILQVKNADGS